MRAMMAALDFRPFQRRLWASDRRPTGQPTAPATPKNRGSLRHPIQWIRTLPLTAPDNQIKTGKPNTTNVSSQPGFKAKRCHYTSNPQKRRHSSYLYPLSRFLSKIR